MLLYLFYLNVYFRLNGVFPCNVDRLTYPLDSHICSIQLFSCKSGIHVFFFFFFFFFFNENDKNTLFTQICSLNYLLSFKIKTAYAKR